MHRDAKVADRWGQAWATRALGRIALASGGRAEATGLLAEALALFTAIPARFETGRTSLDLAILAATCGDLAEAAARGAAAYRIFVDLDAPRYTERAERLAKEIGQAPS